MGLAKDQVTGGSKRGFQKIDHPSERDTEIQLDCEILQKDAEKKEEGREEATHHFFIIF